MVYYWLLQQSSDLSNKRFTPSMSHVLQSRRPDIFIDLETRRRHSNISCAHLNILQYVRNDFVRPLINDRLQKSLGSLLSELCRILSQIGPYVARNMMDRYQP